MSDTDMAEKREMILSQLLKQEQEWAAPHNGRHCSSNSLHSLPAYRKHEFPYPFRSPY